MAGEDFSCVGWIYLRRIRQPHLFLGRIRRLKWICLFSTKRFRKFLSRHSEVIIAFGFGRIRIGNPCEAESVVARIKEI